MTEQLIHAADRLDQAEDQLSELVTWLKDITDDLVFLATIAEPLLECLECLPTLIRPMIVPATEQHRQLARIIHLTQRARLLWNLRTEQALQTETADQPNEPGDYSPPTPEQSPASPPQATVPPSNCEPCRNSPNS